MREEYKEYLVHPRILELRFSIFFNNLRREYTYNDIINIFQGLAQSFRCDWGAIKGIIDSVHDIRRLEKIDWLRFRQEVLFAGYIQGKTKYQIATEIGIAPNNLYSKRYPYDVEDFVDGYWLNKLDKSVTLCGIPQYRKEIYKLILGIETIMGAL